MATFLVGFGKEFVQLSDPGFREAFGIASGYLFANLWEGFRTTSVEVVSSGGTSGLSGVASDEAIASKAVFNFTLAATVPSSLISGLPPQETSLLANSTTGS